MELFNGLNNRPNLQNEVKDGVYAANLDDYLSAGTYCIVCYFGKGICSFDCFGVEHFPAEVKKIFVDIDEDKVVANIFRLPAYYSIT